MIDYLEIKRILIKLLIKSREGKVLVERIETNTMGTTYKHRHWVLPEDMKDTDKVIGGFRNLPQGHPQQLHPLISQAKFSRNGEFSKELTDKLGRGDVIGYVNSKGQRYFKIGTKSYNLIKVSRMLKKNQTIRLNKLLRKVDFNSGESSYEIDRVMGYLGTNRTLSPIVDSTGNKKFELREYSSSEQFTVLKTYSVTEVSQKLDEIQKNSKSARLFERVEGEREQYNYPGLDLSFDKKSSEKIQKILSSSDETTVALYKTLGICASDDGAYGFLQRLYTEYESKKDEGFSPNHEVICRISSVSEEEYKRISDRVAETWTIKTSFDPVGYKIHGIYRIDDLPVESAFQKIAEANKKYESKTAGGKNCHIDTFYNGTAAVASIKILGHDGQFKIMPSKCGKMLGDAIYLAEDSSKSAKYVSDRGHRYSDRGSLFICEASLGNCNYDSYGIMPGKYDDMEYLKDDFNSAGVGREKDYDGVFDNKRMKFIAMREWATFDPRSVIPRYIIDFEVDSGREE